MRDPRSRRLANPPCAGRRPRSEEGHAPRRATSDSSPAPDRIAMGTKRQADSVRRLTQFCFRPACRNGKRAESQLAGRGQSRQWYHLRNIRGRIPRPPDRSAPVGAILVPHYQHGARHENRRLHSNKNTDQKGEGDSIEDLTSKNIQGKASQQCWTRRKESTALNSIPALAHRKSLIPRRQLFYAFHANLHPPAAWQVRTFRIILHWKRSAFQDHPVLDNSRARRAFRIC